MTERKIGLIAGNGDIPLSIINKCYKSSLDICVIFIQADITSVTNVIEQFPNLEHKVLMIGQVGAAIDYFRANKVTDIVFVGGVNRPNFKSLNVDYMGAKLLANILKNKLLGDDSMLRIVADFFEKQGFKVVSPKSILNEGVTIKAGIIVPPKGEVSKSDIELGLRVARTIGEFDIGQSVIVENGVVIGVEAAEGTDNLISRCSQYLKTKDKAILIKAQKPNQDTRLDIPTIGVKTIENAAKFGIAGIIIEENNVFVVDCEKVVEKAAALGVFLISVKNSHLS